MGFQERLRTAVGRNGGDGHADIGHTMAPVAREALAERLERLKAIDPVAGAAQKVVRKAVPDGTRLKDVLSGTWLGHPVHRRSPTSSSAPGRVPGCWTSSAGAARVRPPTG